MINGKAIGVSAAAAFALSFLTGIISRNSFPAVFFRAFIFALVFAVLAALISFLYGKFLSGGSPDEGQTRDSAQPKTGSNVDIVISDDNLDDDGKGPNFFVENNRQSFSQDQSEKVVSAPDVTDVIGQNQNKDSSGQDNSGEGAASPDAPDKALSGQNENQPAHEEGKTENPSFQPSSFAPASLEKVAGGSEKQEEKSDSLPSADASGGQKSSGFDADRNIGPDDIDELPDIEDFQEDGEKNESSDIIEDSDFASNGASESASAMLPNGVEASAQNADVMAQAIRTLLKNDSN